MAHTAKASDLNNGTSVPSEANDAFYKDILEGLNKAEKHLPSKYFYDTEGDRLFREIMNCDEYYPYNCELEIFSSKAAELAEMIMTPGDAFDLIELGAGDCRKSIYLLRHLSEVKADFVYKPIDISADIITYLSTYLPQNIAGIDVQGLNGEYFDMLARAGGTPGRRKVVLFLGSNLGNMLPEDAAAFCRRLRGYLNPGDSAIIGLDLKKDPEVILAAYNDKGGITRDFNLNLLHRINREMGADFDTSRFKHFPVYDPRSGACKSYLVSREKQIVTLSGKEGITTIKFAAHEAVLMEISQKYTPEQIDSLGEGASFKALNRLLDSKGWFADVVWEAV